ncbi:TlpA family protein disulfide reductase [Ramlibacter sp.]|uniref:TlpA family protein disulfide reductase n=1 Tax=Ramlibacter sp. TaxID=1917967 RepID=UPI003D116A5C
MTRRGVLLSVAGVAGLAGGLGFALYRHSREGGNPGLPNQSSGAPSDPATANLWTASFDTPQGPPLAMSALRGKPLLVNFWATWCPPCVEELPLIDAFYRQHVANGWQVIGLAIDQPSSVRRFLEKTPVSFPIGFAGLEGTELAKALGNLAGGLPFTVVLGADGGVRQRRMGRVTEADLKQWSGLR